MHPVERLVAYRLAVGVADEVYAKIRTWPRFESWTVGEQLIRSLDSVGANIAESCGRWHTADRKRLLLIARGSLLEADHWLKRAEARGLIDAAPREQLAEAGRALNGLIKRPVPD